MINRKAKSSVIDEAKKSNSLENTPFLKNLSLIIMYITIETKIVFRDENLYFQFKKEIRMTPADKPKNIQI